MGFGDSLVRNLGLGVPAKQEAGFCVSAGKFRGYFQRASASARGLRWSLLYDVR